MLIFRSGKTLVLPTNQRACHQNSKLIGHRAIDISGSKFEAVVADVIDQVTPAHSKFSCLLFAVCVEYGVLMRESNFRE